MKYLADISQIQGKKIKKLIEDGQYESVAQFISVAVENQLYLEESEETQTINQRDLNVDENVDRVSKAVDFDRVKLTNIHSEPELVIEPTFDQLVLSNGEKKEEHTWLWGQINKILPVKVGVRVLLLELKERKWMELDHFLEEATNEAAQLGNLIRSFEDKNDKKRDEKISAGLPDTTNEKSQTRYKSHFLTQVRRDGLLNGAMAILRFVNINTNGKSDKQFIGLTKHGLKFATLSNPVLDMENFDLSLSNSEAQFYLEHSKKHVINEHQAILWVLRKINNGINERDALNQELKEEYGDYWEASDAVINTQRAGLMARMFELGLLDKDKKGIYVTYKLSEFGKSYLTKN